MRSRVAIVSVYRFQTLLGIVIATAGDDSGPVEMRRIGDLQLEAMQTARGDARYADRIGIGVVRA